MSRKVPIPHSLSHEIQSTLSDPAFAESINAKFAFDPGFVRRQFYERTKDCDFDKKNETLLCTAENQFEGVVTHVNQGKVNTEVVVRISDVTELCSVINTESHRRVGLKKADRFSAVFNSFAVVLHAG
jgi:molybdopterin-binding protein